MMSRRNIWQLLMPQSKIGYHTIIGLLCLAFLLIVPAISCHAQGIEFGSYDPNEYQQQCNAANFEAQYGGSAQSCWSCDVIAIMMDTMITIVQDISPAAVELAKLILIYGTAVWLGMFFLKSLSAATAQDPMQVLTALFTFMFKVALVFILVIDGGFVDLIDWIINPLLSIGIDIGKEFTYWTTGGA